METKKLVNTHTFTVNCTTAKSEELSGTFTVHRPNMGEMIRIGVAEARELGGMSNVDPATAMVASMIATLEIVIDVHPDWWKPRELYDAEVIQEVYNKYVDYLRQFQKKPSAEGTS